MKIFHIVKVYFERRRIDIDQAWLDARYVFFRDNTLRSLGAQRHDDFMIWACCGPHMETMVDGLRPIVPNAVFTFNQHFPSGSTEFPNSMSYVLSRLEACDYVYVTRVDSDDLLAAGAMGCVDAVRPAKPGRVEAAIFQTGYMHEVGTKKLGVYHNPSSPFHTLMFPRDLFLDPDLYAKLFIGDHSKVRAAYHCHDLPEFQFCVLIHGRNFLSTFDYSRVASQRPNVTMDEGWTIDRFIAGKCS